MMPKDNHRRNKLDSIRQFGVFVGIVPRTGEFVVLTPESAVAVRTVHRLSEDQKMGHRVREQGQKCTVGLSRPMPETTSMMGVFQKE